jgi:hypothetical protein
MSKLSAIYNVPSEEIIITNGFAVYYPITGAEDWTAMGARLAILAYTFPLYFEFSGYCDLSS